MPVPYAVLLRKQEPRATSDVLACPGPLLSQGHWYA
ncbi:hypothetical protein S2M10_36210 [Sphingomonas sp. S2M10]|nr:hypothetical protein [Sphingomonas sp. S2M10]